MAFIYDFLHGDKRRPPLPPKKKEEMPHAKMGITYKEWHDRSKGRHTWRNRRWAFLIFINVLFIVSYHLGLGVLEGSLSGSRLLGLYLMDPFNSMQELTIASLENFVPRLTTNFWTGFITILVFYWIVGGRAFCSWVCPYHLLAEWGEKLHDYLVKKKKIKEKTYNIAVKYVFWAGFILLAALTKELVFEDLNPVGILSRSMIYGPGLALIWVIFLLAYEIIGIKRFWCRYICPIGVTYSFVGELSPINIKFELDKCGHCADCQDVCLVPHELWFVKRGKATREVHYTGGDCTKCGLCVDVCPGNALSFGLRDSDKVLG